MTYAPLPTTPMPFPAGGSEIAFVLLLLLALSVAALLAAVDRRPSPVHCVHQRRRGATGLVRRWAGVLRALEGLHFVRLARRLRGEGELVAAGNELRAAARDVQEAAALLSERDPLVVRLRERVRSEALELRNAARRTAASLRRRTTNGELQPA